MTLSLNMLIGLMVLSLILCLRLREAPTLQKDENIKKS